MKGRQLPKLTAVLADPATLWTSLVMPTWYGDKRCRLEFVTGTAIWYHPGLPPLPIRWVLVRDPGIHNLGERSLIRANLAPRF